VDVPLLMPNYLGANML